MYSLLSLNEKIVMNIEIFAIINVILSVLSKKIYNKILNCCFFFIP